MSVKALLTEEKYITVQNPSTQNYNSVFGEIEINYPLAALPLFLKDTVTAKLKGLQQKEAAPFCGYISYLVQKNLPF